VSFIDGDSRDQISLLPACVDDYVAPDALVRVVDAFVASLDLAELGFNRVVAAATGRPGYQPGDMLRLYIWGYLNQVRSSRHLEKACVRDLEAMWLMRRLAPDYRTIAAFRHDNPEAIVSASAAFVQFCRAQGLIGGHMVALDGTKMRAVASPKNIAGADRLARDVAHTEKEIAYYLDRLDIIDETVARGYEDQPLHRENFQGAIASLQRRKDRLVKRQQELERRDEKVLVFGEPEARPMGYGRAPKVPSYNLQSVVDTESGLIVHHDVYNDANDSHLLHPLAVAAKQVLKIDQIQVLTDGGYSNAEEIARCERDAVVVAAPIKRGAMNSEHFRPAQFIYDEGSDTLRCPAGETLRPMRAGLHLRGFPRSKQIQQHAAERRPGGDLTTGAAAALTSDCQEKNRAGRVLEHGARGVPEEQLVAGAPTDSHDEQVSLLCVGKDCRVRSDVRAHNSIHSDPVTLAHFSYLADDRPGLLPSVKPAPNSLGGRSGVGDMEHGQRAITGSRECDRELRPPARDLGSVNGDEDARWVLFRMLLLPVTGIDDCCRSVECRDDGCDVLVEFTGACPCILDAEHEETVTFFGLAPDGLFVRFVRLAYRHINRMGGGSLFAGNARRVSGRLHELRASRSS